MSNYKTILDKDDIVLKKKDNTFKLEANKNIKIPSKILDMIESMEIYNLFKVLNPKLITKSKIMDASTSNPQILLCLKNFMENDEDQEENSNSEENFYISFTNTIKEKDNSSITLEGKRNNLSIEKDGWKKLEIDDITFSAKLSGSELSIKLKFTYIGEKMPVYAENAIGLVFRKFVKNLMEYLSK